MTIQEAQQSVDQWIKENGVRYFNELTNMAILTEEVGEVARIIARKYGEQSFKDDEAEMDLGNEFADVLFVLICLANQTGVDLAEALKINKGLRRGTYMYKGSLTNKQLAQKFGLPFKDLDLMVGIFN